MRKLKGDNRGLSLIEVLVAVMIIALVAVPIMHSFVTSAHANSRAKRTHKATVLAQSVMEGIKSEKLEDICAQFNYPNVDFRIIDPSTIGGGNLSDSVSEMGSTYIKLKRYGDLSGADQTKANVTASVYSPDNGATIEFLGQASGTYYFGLEDVKADTTLYDVLIKIDASARRSSGANSKEMSQVQPIDLEKDVMFIQKDEYTQAAVNEFVAIAGTTYESTIRDTMTRTITIEVVPPVGGVTKVKVTYEYNCYVVGAGGRLTPYVKEDYRDITQDLRSVYLYYYPLYNGFISDPLAGRDTIVFKNTGKLPLDFYLMKQKGASITEQRENWYLPFLSFVEAADTTETNMATRLRTNLVMNIVTDNFFTNFSNFKVMLSNTYSPTLDVITSPTSVLATDTPDRLFDVTVGIYEDGAKDGGYPAADKLAEISGSRLQ